MASRELAVCKKENNALVVYQSGAPVFGRKKRDDRKDPAGRIGRIILSAGIANGLIALFLLVAAGQSKYLVSHDDNFFLCNTLIALIAGSVMMLAWLVVSWGQVIAGLARHHRWLGVFLGIWATFFESFYLCGIWHLVKTVFAH